VELWSLQQLERRKIFPCPGIPAQVGSSYPIARLCIL
jgi:hypothetical protein